MASNPSFEFSHIECLLFALHTLGKKSPDQLNFITDPEKLKDFRARLQFLARGTQGYIKKLEEAVKGKKDEDLKTEENKLKLTALKTTSNISALIRDLFHTPPSFKTSVQLSWVEGTIVSFFSSNFIILSKNNSEIPENRNETPYTNHIRRRQGRSQRKHYSSTSKEG